MSFKINHRGLTSRSPGPFNPLTQVSALHGIWASDPSWTNPGDGSPVASIRNVSGGTLDQATQANQPNFVLSHASFNNRPVLDFTAFAQFLDTDIVDIAQPFKIVVVCRLQNTSSSRTIIGRGVSTSANGFVDLGTSSGYRLTFGGTALNTVTTVDTNPHVYRMTINGASSTLWRDETSLGSGNAGTSALTRFTIAQNYDGAATNPGIIGQIPFVGIYDGSVSDSSLTTLCRNFGSFYGFTVA